MQTLRPFVTRGLGTPESFEEEREEDGSDWTVEEFKKRLRFQSLEDAAATHPGWTPLRYAVYLAAEKVVEHILALPKGSVDVGLQLSSNDNYTMVIKGSPM